MMKLNFDVSCHILIVNTRFQVHISKHVEKKLKKLSAGGELCFPSVCGHQGAKNCPDMTRSSAVQDHYTMACGAHPCRSCMVAPRDYFQDDKEASGILKIIKSQATGLDACASRVKCPARFVSHLHDICIYMSCL